MSKTLYEVQGKPVHEGDWLWVRPTPALLWRAGTKVKAYRPAANGEATMRCENGAVPTVAITDLSWEPWAESLVADVRDAARQDKYQHRSNRDWLDAIVWAVAHPIEAAEIAQRSNTERHK